MDRRFIFAVLRRVLPPGVTLPSPEAVVLDAAAGTLRVTHLRLALGDACLGALFGVSISIPQLSVVCDCAEVHLRLRADEERSGEPKEASLPPGPAVARAAAQPRGAHDAVSTAAIDSLLQWLVQLTANSAVEVGRLVIVADHPEVGVGLGIVLSKLVLRSSGRTPTIYAAALDANVASVSVHSVALSDAAERRTLVGREGSPLALLQPFESLPLLSISALQAAYGIPVLHEATSQPATLRVNAQAVGIRVDTSSLARLLTRPPQETRITASTVLPREHVASDVSTPAEVLPRLPGGAAAGAGQDPLARAIGQTPAPSGGLFSAARELWTAVWTGADSVHVPSEAATGRAAVTAEANASEMDGALGRLMLGSPEIDDADYDDMLSAASGMTATGGTESVLRASMYASFSAPPRGPTQHSPPPPAAEPETVAPGAPLLMTCSLSIRRAHVELLLDDISSASVGHEVSQGYAGRQPLAPAVIITVDEIEASSAPDSTDGKTSLGWRTFEMRLAILSHDSRAAAAISDVAVTGLLQALRCHTEPFLGGVTLHAHLARVSLSVLSVSHLAKWLALSAPASAALAAAVRAPRSEDQSCLGGEAIEPGVSSSSVSSDLYFLRLSVDEIDVSCGLAVPGDAAAGSVLARCNFTGVDVAHGSTPLGAAVMARIGARGTRELVCSAQRVYVVLDGTDAGGLTVGSPIPCITIVSASVPDLPAPERHPAAELWMGATHITLPWSVVTLVSISLPVVVAEAVQLQNAVTLVVGGFNVSEGVQTAKVAEPSSRRLLAGRISISLSIPPPLSTASLEGVEGSLEAVLFETDGLSGFIASCGSVNLGARDTRTGSFSPCPLVTWGSSASFVARRCISMRFGGESVSAPPPSHRRVRVDVSDLVILRSVRLAESALVAALAVASISPPVRKPVKTAALPPRQVVTTLLHVELNSIYVSEVDVDVAAVVALSRVVADVLPLGWESTVDVGAEAVIESAVLHVLRRAGSDMGDLARRCSVDAPVLALNDIAVLYCSSRGGSTAVLGDIAAIPITLSEDSLVRLVELVATLGPLERRIKALAELSLTARDAESRRVTAPAGRSLPLLPAPPVSPHTFCASAPVISVEQLSTVEAPQGVGGADWDDGDAEAASPSSGPTPGLPTVVSSDFESSALVVETPASFAHALGGLDEHAAVAVYRQAMQVVNGALSSVVARVCSIEMTSLQPDVDRHSSEEWALGCAPVQASPHNALNLCAWTLRSLTISYSISRSEQRYPFQGVLLDVRGIRALYSQFRAPAAPSFSTLSPFGWVLSQRAVLIVEDLIATDALPVSSLSELTTLAPESAAQDGQGSVSLVSKAVSGAQQVAIRCVSQWVSPASTATMTSSDPDAELRVWLDTAPLEINLRGRVVLLGQRICSSLAAANQVDLTSESREDAGVPGPTPPSASQSSPDRALFFQLICVSQQRLKFSFTPEPGMTQLSLGGDARASVPLLPVDGLELFLRSVRVCSAEGIDAASRALLAQFTTQVGVGVGVLVKVCTPPTRHPTTAFPQPPTYRLKIARVWRSFSPASPLL